jgi:hypothetical protein
VLLKNILDHSAAAIAWFFLGFGIFKGSDPFLGWAFVGNPPIEEFAAAFQQFGFVATAVRAL